MRIRLKLAVIDVRTGGWTMLMPEPSEDKAWTTQVHGSLHEIAFAHRNHEPGFSHEFRASHECQQPSFAEVLNLREHQFMERPNVQR